MNKWGQFAGYRFMDWGATNDSEDQYWSNRRPADYRNYTNAFNQTDNHPNSAMPIEVLVELCNETNRDGWFCVPHLANDDYVNNLANYLKNNMNSGLTIYIEYSNETWNGIFDQAKYCKAGGKALWPNISDFQAQLYYSGYRSDQIFDIFNNVFSGQTDRVICVAASQSGNDYTGNQVLTKCADTVEAFAIAPYFGGELGNPNNTPHPDDVEHWSVSYALDYLKNTSIAGKIQDVRDKKALTDSYGIPLIAYEGGQHLVGVYDSSTKYFWNKDPELNALFDAVNRDSRLEGIYEYYFDQWKANGGSMFAAFASTSGFSESGRWGLDEYFDQPLSDAPKLKGTLDWIANN